MSEPQLIVLGRSRGQPARAGVRSTKRVEFVTTETEWSHLKQMAATEGKPIATVIRDAVNTYVADYGERRVFESDRRLLPKSL